MRKTGFFNFLNGLRPEFEQVRSSLLSAFTSPSLEDVITKLSGEETRMGISKNNPSILVTSSTQEDSEMVNAVSRPGNNVKTYRPPHFKNQGQGGNDRYGKRDYSKLNCHFCKEPGHIKPICPKWKKLIATAMASQAEERPSSSSESLSLQQIVEALQPLLKGGISGAAMSSSSPGKTSWLLDSGASFHMTPSTCSLSNFSKNSFSSFVSTADGTPLEIKGIGNFERQDFFVPKIRLIPKLNLNLLSVSQLSDHGCDIKFSSNKCWIQDRQSGRLIGEGSRRGDLYYVDFLQVPKSQFCNVVQNKDIHVWHKRLGHPNIVKISYLPFIKHLCKSDFLCNECILGKMKCLPFPQRSMFTTNHLKLSIPMYGVRLL